ncbi:MAG: OmpA family protein [Alphaproteobacteria bacterium]|nr:OmpA family protein [Alphaproteobacteria bacterium]
MTASSCLKRLGLLAGAAALGAGLTAAAGAQAQEPPGYYVGVGIGYNLARDSDIDGAGFSSDADYDSGLPSYGGGAIGFDYAGPWRGELELGFRSNDVDSVGAANASGAVDVTALMINGFYDFEGLLGPVTPYLGAGVGLAQIKAEDVFPVNGALSESSDNVLAAQLLAGAAVEIVQDLDLTGQYAYFMTRDAELRNAAGVGYDLEYAAHTFTLGLRFNFPEPEPAPEPAPEPVAQPEPEPEPAPEPEPEPIMVRNFLVFFDWDSAVVTPEAMTILREAVGYAEQGNVARVVLTGHADTSGPNAYNMRLSQRRADAVQTEIVGLGFGGAIDTIARGEEEPLVATGDGVREPQNRRVEILLQ